MLTEPIQLGIVYKTRDGRKATVTRFHSTDFYAKVGCTLIVDMKIHGPDRTRSWTCWADGRFPGRGSEKSKYLEDIVDFWEPKTITQEQLDLFL